MLATRVSATVREFPCKAFDVPGKQLSWLGVEKTETGHDQASGKVRICIDSSYYRTTVVDLLLWDAAKALKLDWTPVYNLDQLVEEIVDEDLTQLQKEY